MDTTLQNCKKCGYETDCIEGLCLDCRIVNDEIKKIKGEILSNVSESPAILDNSILLDWADRLDKLI